MNARRARLVAAVAATLILARAWLARGQAEAQGPPQPVTPPAAPAVPPEPPSAPAPALELPAALKAPMIETKKAQTWAPPHYDKGFVIVSSPDPAEERFHLQLNHVSQFRYTNSMATKSTYTDHFGNELDVQRRNDIQLVRDAFYFNGFVWDRRLDFNVLVFTSSATLVATAAGYIGFVFDKRFALRAGYFSLPSARSMTGTYPFFHGQDRSLSNNYFRGGFTQGVWASGELLPGFNYIGMVGNSLNTLDLKAAQIDNHLAGALSVWYDLNKFGGPWNDWEYHEGIALRLGTAFTYSREDRLSNLAAASPENNLTYISDGHLLFETGAIAAGVTLQLADFYLSAVDVGLKFRGLAVNAELYNRWLNRFRSDGALPINHMYDWGFEASLGYFVLRHKLEPMIRGSYINGPYGNSGEGAVGLSWYPFPTRWIWLNLEVIGVSHSPYFSGYYAYAVGQTGVVIPLQFLLRF